MRSDLLFSLDKVMPFFLLILTGYLLKRLKFLPDAFLDSLNKFVYRLALPLSLFSTTSAVKGFTPENRSFMLAAAFLIFATFSVIWLIAELCFRDKRIIGTLVQGAFRGNFVLLGIPLATAVVGPEAAVPASIAMAAVIPVYSTLSVLVLVARGVSGDKINIKRLMVGIVTTPLLIAIMAGFFVSWIRLPIPGMVMQTIDFIGATATPLGLLAIGGLFNMEAATSRLRPSIFSSIIKLILMPVAVIAACYAMGFSGADLFLFYILFGAPVAISSYAMATELGGDGPLASNILIVTTFFSSFTLSAGIYIMRTLEWI